MRPRSSCCAKAQPDPSGNAALIAAGTGLGIALLPNIGGRFVPRASEGGHADFAARNADEQTLHNALAREYGRTDVERVVSGPGLANIHRFLCAHQCETLTPFPAVRRSYRQRSRGQRSRPDVLHASERWRCSCRRMERRQEIWRLTVLATAGLYLGGGIAPRILPALRWPIFLDAFLAKSPMDALIARIPVKVIVNPRAGLLGAATYANLIK